MSTAEQITDYVRRLTEAQQMKVLDFAQSLGSGILAAPPGAKLEDLLRFAGSIPPEDLRQMQDAIEEGCEQVNPDGW